LAIPITIHDTKPQIVNITVNSTPSYIAQNIETAVVLSDYASGDTWNAHKTLYVTIPANATIGSSAGVQLSSTGRSDIIEMRGGMVVPTVNVVITFNVVDSELANMDATAKSLIATSAPVPWQSVSEGALQAELSDAMALKDSLARVSPAPTTSGLATTPDYLFVALALLTLASLVILIRGPMLGP